ncbi:unnamed protein product, partial [Anisakis simplex]|uniref:Cyclin_C domain-containing protein n=1 Tax=Anisakis simplex TaxID=6269 RepID=A0A0M3JHI7_ANISI
MLTVKAESTCMRAAELTCAAEISRLHLPYELSERKRFQQYRDTVASKALSGNGNNNSTTSKLSGAANHNSSSKISGSSAAHSQSKNVAPHSQSKMSQHIVGGGAARLSIS